MPEEIEPPKTIPEVGIHLMYLVKAQNETSKAVSDVHKTLEKLRENFVPKVDFDEHVTWGETQVALIDGRLKVVEERHLKDDASVIGKVLKSLDKKIVAGVVALILGAVGYQIYMTARVNDIITKYPAVDIQEK